ncbi:hypothetical protein D3C81_1807040 [compost metagenome]
MQQIQGMVGEGPGEVRQAARDVLGIATEVDQCLGAVMRAHRHQHLRLVHGQGQQRVG